MIMREQRSLKFSLIVVVVVLLAALSVGNGTVHSAEPFLQQTDLFEANKDGYVTYRIPGIVITNKGTLLAYCEARKDSAGDWADIDVLLRRSTDGGQTWDSRQLLADSDMDTVNNPVAIVDPSTDRIRFLYCVNYSRCFSMYSDDDGRTFSEPVDITETFEAFRKDYDWTVIATGPGHGIRLRNGRFIVPVWLSDGGGRSHRPSAVSVIYSDDQGESWHRGGLVCVDPDPLVNPSETIAVQLSDGRVLLNIRNENRVFRRAISFSDDGATGWSTPVFDEQLYEPVCMASIVAIPNSVDRNSSTFVFANPFSESNPRTRGKNNFRYRENLTIRLSDDDCSTWPVSRVLEPGTSGYSDMAVDSEGTIYCLYERGGDDGFALGALTLARFNRAWIEAGNRASK